MHEYENEARELIRKIRRARDEAADLGLEYSSVLQSRRNAQRSLLRIERYAQAARASLGPSL